MREKEKEPQRQKHLIAVAHQPSHILNSTVSYTLVSSLWVRGSHSEVAITERNRSPVYKSASSRWLVYNELESFICFSSFPFFFAAQMFRDLYVDAYIEPPLIWRAFQFLVRTFAEEFLGTRNNL